MIPRPDVTSTLVTLDAGKLELRPADVGERKPITSQLHLIHRGREWRFDLEALIVAEAVAAARPSLKHGAVISKLPFHGRVACRAAPCSNDRMGATAGDDEKNSEDSKDDMPWLEQRMARHNSTPSD